MRNRHLLACLLLAGIASGPSPGQTFAAKPFLSVQGHAETKVKPDIFPITVTLEETGMDAGAAQALIEGLAGQVVAAAKSLNAADGDMQVGNVGVTAKTKYDEKDDKEVFLGNTYSREIQVRFHALDALRKFIAAVPAVKQVRLETDDFEYSKDAEVKRRLRREAIDDARKGAQDMAAAVGKKLLDLFNVSDRAQSTIYAASGYNSASASLGSVSVMGSPISRTSEIVLKDGEVTIKSDAFLVYLIGD